MGGFFQRPAPQQAVPQDLNGIRQSILQAILGGGAVDPYANDRQRITRVSGMGGPAGRVGREALGRLPAAPSSQGQGGGLLSLLQQFGQGQAGQTSDLQRMSSQGIGQFLNQPAPEQRALDISLPALQQQLSGTPGGDVLDPLQAIFQRNLTDTLQQQSASAPGRWSSGLMEQQGRTRERSLGDFNLLASQVMEQGRQRQLQAASTLGMLSGQAGQNPFQRLLGAGQLGTQQTQFGQQQQLQAIMALLAPVLGPTFGGPFTQNPSGWENLLGGVQAVGSLIPGGGGTGGST